MKKNSSWTSIICLFVAGESIYMLPYMRKTFQTSIEEVFQVSSTELGVINGVFGLLALLSYFPSGQLADRFSTKKLLILSLFITGSGGLLLLMKPQFYGMLTIHALWGVSSILTFWAPLIKATRHWGARDRQGISFGILDGGMGLTGALLSSLATLFFAYSDNTKEGILSVILIYSLGNFLAALAIWKFLDIDDPDPEEASENKLGHLIVDTLKYPQVWILGVIILCSYTIYLGTYEFPSFVERSFAQSKVFGATMGTIRDWMRPMIAIAAGLMADKLSPSKTILSAFIISGISFLGLSLMATKPDLLWALWIQVIIISCAVFSLRAVYFALIEESKIPFFLTGTTVGIVSFLGFTPDIFAHSLSGWFVDNFTHGHQYYFALLAGVASIGIIATYFISRLHIFSKKTN